VLAVLAVPCPHSYAPKLMFMRLGEGGGLKEGAKPGCFIPISNICRVWAQGNPHGLGQKSPVCFS